MRLGITIRKEELGESGGAGPWVGALPKSYFTVPGPDELLSFVRDN